MKNDANGVKNDVKDTAAEIKHRTTAEVERLKRDAFADEMTTGEKVRSGVNEIENRTEAEIDKAKRDLRHKR